MTSIEHPQTNDQVEVVNKVIFKALYMRLDKSKGLWKKELPSIHCVNVCIHDFDDVKRRIKQDSFCFKINTRLFNKQSLVSRFTKDQALS